MAALSTAEAPRLIPERTLPWFLGTALGYFLLSSLTLAGFPRTEAVVAFFPASGLALAAMLLTPRHQRPWLALGILVADFTADQVFGRPILVAHLTFAPIMAIEAWLGAWLIEWWLDGRSPDIRSLADFGTIVTASAIGSTLVGGVLGGLAQRELFGLPFFPALWNWWAPDLMASSVLTPALLFSAQLRQETATPSPGVKPEGLLFLLTFGAVLWEVHMNGIPIGASQVLLLLAALPFLGWAALRLGPTWTAWGTVLLTAVSVAATAYGRGPFIATSADPFSRMLWCQAFCMVTSLSMMVLAQTLREQRSAALRLAEALQALTVSNARIQAQFQGSSDPMAMVDSELRLVAFNPAWAELVGHSAGPRLLERRWTWSAPLPGMVAWGVALGDERWLVTASGSLCRSRPRMETWLPTRHPTPRFRMGRASSSAHPRCFGMWRSSTSATRNRPEPSGSRAWDALPAVWPTTSTTSSRPSSGMAS